MKKCDLLLDLYSDQRHYDLCSCTSEEPVKPALLKRRQQHCFPWPQSGSAYQVSPLVSLFQCDLAVHTPRLGLTEYMDNSQTEAIAYMPSTTSTSFPTHLSFPSNRCLPTSLLQCPLDGPLSTDPCLVIHFASEVT